MNPTTPPFLHPDAAPGPYGLASARAGVHRLDAGAIIDAAGTCFAPASLLLEIHPPVGPDGPSGRAEREAAGGPRPAVGDETSLRPPAARGRARVLAVGTPAHIDTHPAASHAHRATLPGHALLPAFVNAHAHLDLTHIGPCPHDEAAGFVGFVDLVRSRRCADEEEIAASVRRGVELSLRAGVVAVGDIAGAARGEPRLAPWRTLADSPLRGVSFLEFFGIAKGEQPGRLRLEAALEEAGKLAAGPGAVSGGVKLGLQPHAPNTVGLRLYTHAAQLARARGLPLCTHLAETPEEHEFIGQATGPQRAFLERLGLWDDAVLAEIGQARTPVEHLRGVLAEFRPVCVHVNDCSDRDLEILAQSGAAVVYCPRASAYFGAEKVLGPHRYRELLSAGIVVALGTDSIINLPGGVEGAGGRGLGVWDEMALLRRRDGADALELLRMGTLHGARVLGLDERAFAFTPGASLAGLVAVEMASPPPDGEGQARARAILRTLLEDQVKPWLLLVGK